MTKAAVLISAILLFAGVAVASSLTSTGGQSTRSIDASTLSTPTGAAPQENRQGGQISGPCDEAEHAHDPRCAGAADAQRGDDGDDEQHNSGPGNNAEDDSGHRDGDNSGPGGGDDD